MVWYSWSVLAGLVQLVWSGWSGPAGLVQLVWSGWSGPAGLVRLDWSGLAGLFPDINTSIRLSVRAAGELAIFQLLYSTVLYGTVYWRTSQCTNRLSERSTVHITYKVELTNTLLMSLVSVLLEGTLKFGLA